jgi:hypothetical protein
MVIKFFLGSALLAFALMAALFVGGYVMLYGGIREFVDGVNATPHDSTEIAVGFIRAFFFETGAFLAAIVPFCIGAALIGSAAKDVQTREASGLPRYADRGRPRR